MTKKEIKELAAELMKEMDKEGLDMELTLTGVQLEKLASKIVAKLVNVQGVVDDLWESTSTYDHFGFSKHFNPKRRGGVNYKAVHEEDLLIGELAKLMTLMNMYEEREEYEKCATIKKEIDKINKRINKK